MKHLGMVVGAILLTPVTAQAQSGTVEQRLQRMEDESEIRRAVIEYGAFLDARDFKSYAGLFARDGVWQGGFGSFTGPDAIQKMLETNLGVAEPGFVNKTNFHMLTNPLIEIEGDRATVTSKYLFWTASTDNRPSPMLAGRYVDDFVREDGRWKIAKRSTWGQIPFRDPNEPGTGGPPIAAPSLEQRLQKAEDILAIQRIIVEYAARIDAQDFDAYTQLFAENGVWQNGTTVRTGRAEIKDMLVGIFGTPPAGFVNSESYHLVSNPQVDVNGDRATARSRHLLVMRGPDGSPVPELAGLYEDEFIRENGEWKILRRVDNPIMPTREEWLKEMQARQAKAR